MSTLWNFFYQFDSDNHIVVNVTLSWSFSEAFEQWNSEFKKKNIHQHILNILFILSVIIQGVFVKENCILISVLINVQTWILQFLLILNRCPRADSKLAPSQWETTLLCNDITYWLGARLESALYKRWNVNLWVCISCLYFICLFAVSSILSITRLLYSETCL